MQQPRTLAAAAVGLDRLIGAAALTSLALLIVGWVLPVMTVRAFFIVPRRISFYVAARELWQGGQFALLGLLVVFSAVVPLAKIVLALHLWYRTDATGPWLARSLSVLAEIAKWSMLDVFVVALTVIGMQAALVGNAFVNPGFYAFVAAVLLSMIVVRRVVVLARRQAPQAHGKKPQSAPHN